MFSYAKPTSKAQTFAIAQAYVDHLLKTHGLPSNAPRQRMVFMPPRPNWPARAIMRARKWRLQAIDEAAIVLGTLIFAATGALLHAAAII